MGAFNYECDGQMDIFECFAIKQSKEEVERAMKKCSINSRLKGAIIYPSGKCCGYSCGKREEDLADECYVCKYNDKYKPSHVARNNEDD